MTIGLARLHSQRLAGSSFTTVEQVVSWLVGLQGQDASSVKWSIGLRLPGSTEADVEKALAAGAVVRTWPMRGTLHLVSSTDVRWLLALLGPGNLARAEYRRRWLELDDTTLARSRRVFAKALRDGKHLTRDELYALLEKARISTAGQRGYHLLWHAAVQGEICSGASRGKEPTFALLDEWVRPGPSKSREEAAPTLVLGGQVVGTWKRTGEVAPFKPMKKVELRAVEAAMARYASFKSA